MAKKKSIKKTEALDAQTKILSNIDDAVEVLVDAHSKEVSKKLIEEIQKEEKPPYNMEKLLHNEEEMNPIETKETIKENKSKPTYRPQTYQERMIGYLWNGQTYGL